MQQFTLTEPSMVMGSDQDFFTRAYKEHWDDLYRYSLFKVHNRENSEDLVQETFMKAWNYLSKGKEILAMKAFLFHVLNDLIINYYRKKKTLSLDALVEKGFDPPVSETERMNDILDGRTAFHMLEKLPPKYQTIMRMRYGQSLTLGEMSFLVGQSKNTVAVQLHRGLEKLKVMHEYA